MASSLSFVDGWRVKKDLWEIPLILRPLSLNAWRTSASSADVKVLNPMRAVKSSKVTMRSFLVASVKSGVFASTKGVQNAFKVVKYHQAACGVPWDDSTMCHFFSIEYQPTPGKKMEHKNPSASLALLNEFLFKSQHILEVLFQSLTIPEFLLVRLICLVVSHRLVKVWISVEFPASDFHKIVALPHITVESRQS